MTWKKKAQFGISVIILIFFVLLLVVLGAYSTGVLDLSSEPVVNAEENTTGVPEVSPSDHADIEGRELEMEIFHRVNEQREKHGREPLVHSERVRSIARLHSYDMGIRNFFNHTNPDGLAPPDRHDKYDGCDRPNENIVEWSTLPTNGTEEIASEVVASWMNSPGHNTTMTSNYYHVAGVGVYVTENKSLYVTQNFCREHPNA